MDKTLIFKNEDGRRPMPGHVHIQYAQSDLAGDRTGTVQMWILALPGKHERTIRVWRRCGLKSNYFTTY